MMKSPMRPIHSLIDSKLLNRTQIVQSLTNSLHSRLSSELRQHCWVIDIIGNTLVLITDNADRATTLRYQQHELLKQVNEEFSGSLEVPVRRMKVKIDSHLSTLSHTTHSSDCRTVSELSNAKNHCRQMLSYLKDN
tara:strand:- start:118676 stop:119083 length:408 start_codon:yes stop_codon:yes gene_type:complete